MVDPNAVETGSLRDLPLEVAGDGSPDLGAQGAVFFTSAFEEALTVAGLDECVDECPLLSPWVTEAMVKY